jgi:arylsulfatase A-like enzyme
MGIWIWLTHLTRPKTCTCGRLLSSLDWFPTIGFLAGYELPAGVKYDGVDVSAAVFSDAPSPRRTFFYHATDETLHFQSNVANETGGLPADPSMPDMPLLMAVRKDQYKLHMYTRGAHALRPAVGRPDWQYPDWACTESLRNHTEDPVLFDLHIDPGETVPRTVCTL